MGTCDDRILRMEYSFRRCEVGDVWRPRSTRSWSFPRTVHRHKTQVHYFWSSTWNAPWTRISWNGKLKLLTVSTAADPGPPLCTTNVKGTFVPAPRPVISAIPVSVAVSSCTLAPVTLPTTYIALTVNSPLSGPLAASGASAKHSNSPVIPPAER